MSAPPAVSVVVAHFEQPHLLDLVLTGLARQTLAPERFEVVVADDGSATAPDPGRRPYPVRVVRQEDRGFRAAAARNLGAAASAGEVLCFLDADTVPEPGYLAAVLAVLGGGGKALTVGRRRHGDLAGFTPARLSAWLGGQGRAPVEFAEPAWLRAAYERTDDLRRAGDDAYRFVISAVLATTRELFDAVGGFEEEFRAYGGEDWEFAHRCWLAGAEFSHTRAAVAWHAGPEFAGRADDDAQRRSRNVEGLTLARFVTDPAARGTGLLWAQPDVVVRLRERGAEDAAVAHAVAELLRGSDAQVWLADGAAARPGGVLAQDPRVHAGEPPRAVLARCRFQADVARPVVLAGATLRDLTDVAPVRVGEDVLVRRTRDLNRGDPGAAAVAGVLAHPVGPVDLQRGWGHEEHARTPVLQRSLRTPVTARSTPSSAP